MKKKMTIVLSILVLFIILSNYSPVKTILGGLPTYSYISENGEFEVSEIPWKGKSFDDTIESFESYKKNNPKKSNIVLYRSFKIQPLKFWNWHEYLTHERYKLPYKKEV